MKNFFSILFFLLLSKFVFGQEPTAGFSTSASESCLIENIIIQNTSINATSYEWDFCLGDFTTQPEVITDIGDAFNSSTGISIIKATSGFYGFILSASRLYRLGFGNTLSNTPTVTDLGNLGLLTNAEDISIVQEEDKWIGFTGFGSTGNGGKVYRLVWDEITGIPTAEALPILGITSRIRGLDVLQEGSKHLLYLMRYDGTLTRADFGGSFLTTLTEDNIYTSGALPEVSNPIDISLIKKGDAWYGIVGSSMTKNLSVYNLGTDGKSAPSHIKSQQFSSFDNLSKLKVVHDNRNYYGLVSTLNSSVHLINMETLLASDTFDEVALAEKPVAYGIDVMKEQSTYYVLGSRTKLQRLRFENECGASIVTSTDENPIVSYSVAGVYDIELSAFNGTTVDYAYNQASVISSEAPAGEVLSDSAYCITSSINLEFLTEETITSYSWDFGDGATSIEQSPSHQYAEAGNYTIALGVESVAGCTNTFIREVAILANPIPVFSTDEEEYCAFESIAFINETAGEYGNTALWSWDFNGEGNSSERLPVFAFDNPGTKTIQLQVNVLGCIDTIEKQVIISEGPQASFIYDRTCLGEDIKFTNTSTGDVTVYEWDFGNGHVSTEEHPVVQYADPGDYEVQLTANTASGCEHVYSATLTIYDQVIESIQNTVAIENLPFQIGAELLEGYNSPLNYEWELEGQYHYTDTAQYILSAGLYNINLTLTTEEGCFFTSEHQIEVEEAVYPTPGFIVPREACLEENIELQNTSINATSYEWDFCLGDFTTQPEVITDIGDAFNSSTGISIIKATSGFYGFILSASRLYRLGFGNTLSNTPTVTDLGNLGLLTNAEDISIVQEGDKWIGFTGFGSTGNGGKVYRLVWDEITGIPTAEALPILGITSRIRGLDVLQEGSKHLLYLMRYDGTLTRADFGGSFLTTLTEDNIYTSGALPEVSNPIDISLIKKGDAWYGIVGSSMTKNLSVYNLGTDGKSAPSHIKSQQFSSFDNLSKLKVVHDNRNYYGLVSTLNSSVHLINMETLLASDTFDEVALAEKPVAYGIDVMKEQSTYYVLGSRTKLQRLRFENECGASIVTSTDENPIVSYSVAGVYDIELSAFNGTTVDYAYNQASVISSEAPAGEVLSDSAYCITSSINLEFLTEETITSYSWDFGDGATSIEQSPSHQYAEAGNYTIALGVESVAGCTNTFIREVAILANPIPVFSTDEEEYCAFESIAFINETAGEYGNTALWSWDFNGEGNSSERLPVFAFDNPGTKTIQLQVNVLGCIDTIEKQVIISEGPQASFIYDRTCLGEDIKFTNTSTGDVTVYEWDFGNGHVSTEEHPVVQYADPGDYEVQLTANTASGCEHVYSATLTIYDQVIESIQNTVAIENLPFQIGAELLEGYNSPLNYEWELEGQYHYTDTAQYILSAGLYNINLTLTTEEGCFFTSEHQIEVEEAVYPTPGFIVPREACLEENIELQNTSINATSYEWDFCLGDFTTQPEVITDIGDAFNSSTGISIIKATSGFYGFILSASRLYRLGFGNTLSNTPTVTDLGNLGLLTNAEDISIVQEEDKWIGFTGFGSTGNGGKVYRLVWDEITGIPTAEALPILGITSRIRGLDVLQEGSKHLLYLMRYDGTLTRADFGGSFLTTLTEDNIYTSGALPEVSNPIDISLIKKGDAWYGIVGSSMTKNLSVYNLGTDGKSAPSHIKSQQFSSFDNLSKLKVVHDNRNYYGLVSTLNSSVHLINMETLLASDTFDEVALAEKPVAYGIDVMKEQSTYYVLGSRTKLQRLRFENECGASIVTSTDENPIVSYSVAGEFSIALKAMHSNGNKIENVKDVDVTFNYSPKIVDLNYFGSCQKSDIRFVGESPNLITSYTWSFGDGSQATETEAHHQYTDPGTYNLRLEVSDGTCSNFTTKEITIYEDAPKPSFNYETLALCTTNEIHFSNNSDQQEIPDSLISYTWNFNNEFYSSTKIDTTIVFDNPGEKTVTLTSSIPGCSNDTTVTYTINQGAAVDFSMENACAEEEVSFTNTTTGEVVSYEWSLGNEVYTEEINPTFTYSDHGEYNILLKATNDFGCVTSQEKTLTIHALPTADFNHDISCEGNVTSFTDLSTVALANITNWEWNINGEKFNGAALDYTFADVASHNVTLHVTSQYNCTSSIIKPVSVMPSPVADFSTNKLCINEQTILTDQSISNSSISNHRWIIGDNMYSTPVVHHNFNEPGSYNVELIVTGSNRCYNSIEKEIIIHAAPEIELIHEVACAGQPLEIMADISSDDPIATVNWYVDSELYGESNSMYFTGKNPGTAGVKLLVTTEGGCSFNELNHITINPTPSADFEASTVYGGAPLEVYFQDFSSGGSNQEWLLNNDQVQVIPEQPFVVTDIGSNIITQIIKSDIGCADSAFLTIDVVPAVLDLILQNIRYINDRGNIVFVADIMNNGSAQVKDMIISLDIDGTVVLKEKLTEFMNAGDKLTRILSSSLENEPRFVCFTIDAANSNLSDADPQDNRICINFENETFFMSPYPNPASDKVLIPIILKENQEVTIEILNSNGTTSFEKSIIGVKSELITYQIDLEGFKQGYYFVKVTSGSESKAFPIVIKR